MAITHTTCSSFKQELLTGTHDFSSDTIKMALYTSSASLGASTTAYTTTAEVSSANYTAGGVTITATVTLSGTTAYVDFADASWSSVTFSPAAALVYNSSQSNKAIMVINFGQAQPVTNGNFVYAFPAAGADTAVLRLP